MNKLLDTPPDSYAALKKRHLPRATLCEEKVVIDAIWAEMKARNADLFPKRLKAAKSLVEYISKDKALPH